jgi:hypothetical protein
MSRHLSSESPTFLLADNLDMQTLHDAQQCLRCHGRHQIPSSARPRPGNGFTRLTTHSCAIGLWTATSIATM